MNGYEFVREVLSRTRNDVGELIRLANGRETEWLEFKAGTGPEGGVYDKGSNKWDYRFDVARGLFALANGIGGALLIGVKETADRDEGAIVVGLQSSGFGGNRDKFMLNLSDQVFSPSDGWRAADQGHWAYKGGWHGLFNPEWGTFLGEPIVIVLVRPRDPGDSWLELTPLDRGMSSFVPVRVPGELGRNKKLDPQEAARWWKTRELDRPDLYLKYAAFDVEWGHRTAAPGTGERSAPEVFASAVRSYLDGLSTETGAIDLEAIERFDEDAGLGGRRAGSRIPARRGKVADLLARERRLVLLGESGSGKSTCLQLRARILADGWTPERPWVITAPLFAYTLAGLRALLLTQLPGLSWADIEPGIDRGQIALFLDGLNECPPELLDTCYDDIDAVLRKYPVARIVVSSRPTLWPRGLELPTFEMLPMGKELQQRFLAARLGESSDADVILAHLHRSPGADFMAGSPMLMSVLAQALPQPDERIDGRAHLYRRFLESWVLREREREASELQNLHLDDVRAALGLLAFHMRTQGLVSCSRAFAERTVRALLGGDAARLLDAMSQGPFLLQHGTAQSLRFAHATIQDYLAAEHIAAHPGALTGDLLSDASAIRSEAWSMPLVLALELMPDPPESCVDVAWAHAPLLVAAALRDSQRLADLQVSGGHWLRMVVGALRGEDIGQVSRDLVYISHVPPKYPLPGEVEGALRGSAFWYAGLSHPAGTERLERLQQQLCAGDYPWLELVGPARMGYPALANRLGPARRLLTGDIEGVDPVSALRKATVAELCVLLRLRKISPQDFRLRWKDALQRGNPAAMERDLVCLLNTDKLLDEEFSPARELVNGYRDQLALIANNRTLSLRLLNVLLRLKVVTSQKIRKDPGRLQLIIEVASNTNLIRFLKQRLLEWDDLPEERAREFLWSLSPEELQKLEMFQPLSQRAISLKLKKPENLGRAQQAATGNHRRS
jgi:hypothetical protein